MTCSKECFPIFLIYTVSPLYIDIQYKIRYNDKRKGKRKVQGVPQSQTAALPRYQEEEETDKTKQGQIKQMYEKH